MGRPSAYSEEFRADAVRLVVDSTPPRTIADVALELGLNRETLRSWVRRAEKEKASQAAGGLLRGRARGAQSAAPQDEDVGGGEGDPAQGHCVFCQGDESLSCRYRFVSAHCASDLPDGQRHAVTRLCEAVNVKRGSYYTWRAAAPVRAAKAAEDLALTGRIREIHRACRCTYGAKRVALDLADCEQGPVNHKKLARLMRAAGLEGRRQRRRRALTKQDKAAPPGPDLLGRDFQACAPDAKWCRDITYIPAGESGFMYLATVIDLFSARLIGWSIAEHRRAEFVRDALAAAVAARGGEVAGVIFHSDRCRMHRIGSQGPR